MPLVRLEICGDTFSTSELNILGKKSKSQTLRPGLVFALAHVT